MQTNSDYSPETRTVTDKHIVELATMTYFIDSWVYNTNTLFALLQKQIATKKNTPCGVLASLHYIKCSVIKFLCQVGSLVLGKEAIICLKQRRPQATPRLSN